MRARQAKKIFRRSEQFWCKQVNPSCYKLWTVLEAMHKVMKPRRRFARKERRTVLDACGLPFILLFLLLPSICFAQATAVISGPTEAAPGDLIILDASQSDCDARVWLLVGSEKSFLQFEDNKKCVFASGATGQYHFVLATGKTIDSAATVATTRHTVTIGGPLPKPDPTPNPKPDPKPPQPGPELTGLAKTAFDVAQTFERKPGEAAKRAAAFETIASKALALNWTLQEIQAEYAKPLFPTTEVSERWKPFSAFMNTVLRGKSPAEVAAALSDIAKGLSAAELVATASPAAQADGPNETLKESVEKIRQSLQGIRQEVGQ